MPNVDPALWRDIMGYLRSRHAPICRQWFEELEPVDFNSGLLKVSTISSVQQNYLQKKCLDQFTEAAQAATGALVAVRFVNGEESRSNGGSPRGHASPGSALAPGHGHNHASTSGTHTLAPSLAPLDPAGNLAPIAVQPLPAVNRPAAKPQPISIGHDGMFEQSLITPDNSFDTFVAGPNNQLAYAAAVAVANQPGTAYNPLFIHGGVGLGKTHLLQAICQQILKNNPATQICYMSCDAFMNQFIECVQSGKMSEFRHRYRHVDVLIIDDIHFLANRERTQEEFFHTFNELYQSNRQIVLSSDSPPSEIPQLEERLVSRFGWGLVAPVSKPDYETRLAIVRSKLKLRGLTMPDDVIAYIATKIDTNARELEGAVTTIQGAASLQNKAIDLTLAQTMLGDAVHAGGSQVTLQNIINAVTAFYNVKLSDLQSKRRHKSITGPRQVCMWLARRRTRFSLEEIGGYFGGRDHTTVMHSIRIVDERSGADTGFAQQLERIDQQIQRAAGLPSAAAPVPAPASSTPAPVAMTAPVPAAVTV